MAKDQSKSKLVELLFEIARLMEIAGENDFKIRAYRKGADAIQNTENSLSDIAGGKVKVPGVGEGLKSAIQEFLSTSTVSALDEFKNKIPAAIFNLLEIPGLGPKKAHQIYSELGIENVGELEYACRENRLVTLKGFGDAIQKKILNSIEDLKRRQGKLRIDQALELTETIEKQLKKNLGKQCELIRIGQLARFSEIVDHLEFLAVGAKKIHAHKLFSGCLTNSVVDEKEIKISSTPFQIYTTILEDGLQISIWTCEKNPDSSVLQILCSDPQIRETIQKTPEKFQDWEPSWLESSWVISSRKPNKETYRIKRHGKVRGIFHCHTNESDGSATLEEMIQGAQSRGYEYIGISDHSQSAFYAQGLSSERIVEQRHKIKALQKKFSIKIFHGVESDILADGELDYDPEILEGFDFIVGSIHSRFKMDLETMTARLVRALENPRITIWGHPTGRLLLDRRGYDLDWHRCLKVAAKCGVAIELNANPHRLDIDWRLGELIEKNKIMICINPDAHSESGLDDTVYGEWMAEKAMVPSSQILNLKTVEEMEKYLWERKVSQKKKQG